MTMHARTPTFWLGVIITRVNIKLIIFQELQFSSDKRWSKITRLEQKLGSVILRRDAIDEVVESCLLCWGHARADGHKFGLLEIVLNCTRDFGTMISIKRLKLNALIHFSFTVP